MQTFTYEGGRQCRASKQKDDKITFSRQDWRCSGPHELSSSSFGLLHVGYPSPAQLSNHVQESGAQEGKNLRPAVYCVRFGLVPAFLSIRHCVPPPRSQTPYLHPSAKMLHSTCAYGRCRCRLSSETIPTGRPPSQIQASSGSRNWPYPSPHLSGIPSTYLLFIQDQDLKSRISSVEQTDVPYTFRYHRFSRLCLGGYPSSQC